MIYIHLFVEFLKIGLFSFGGAYGAIPLIKESVVGLGWMDEAMFSNIVAVSESTPGPIMVNAATYIGNTQGGVPGAVIATLGVVLPSFIIILLVTVLLGKWIRQKKTQCILKGIKPCLMGVILATGVSMVLTNTCQESTIDSIGVIILCVLLGFEIVNHYIRKKESSPIILIILSAVMGIVMY